MLHFWYSVFDTQNIIDSQLFAHIIHIKLSLWCSFLRDFLKSFIGMLLMRHFTFCFHTKFSKSTLYFVLLSVINQGWSHIKCSIATRSWWLLYRTAQLYVVELCTLWSPMALSVLANKSSLQLQNKKKFYWGILKYNKNIHLFWLGLT